MKWNEMVLVTIKTTSHETRKEIIEIGLCKFDVKTLKRREPLSLFVKPINTKITEYCTNITGVHHSDVIDAVSFFDLCDFMQEVYNTKNVPWASYGNFADIVFKRQCEDYNIDNPLSNRFINLRHFFSLTFNQNEEISLNEALNILEIPVWSNTCEDEVLNLGILLASVLNNKIVKSGG